MPEQHSYASQGQRPIRSPVHDAFPPGSWRPPSATWQSGPNTCGVQGGVRHPDAIGRRSREVAGQEIRRDRLPMLASVVVRQRRFCRATRPCRAIDAATRLRLVHRPSLRSRRSIRRECGSPTGHPKRPFLDGGGVGAERLAVASREGASLRYGGPAVEHPLRAAIHLPHTRGPRLGESCPPATAGQPATHLGPSSPHQLGPGLLACPVPALVPLDGGPGGRQARHRGPLAPGWVPP